MFVSNRPVATYTSPTGSGAPAQTSGPSYATAAAPAGAIAAQPAAVTAQPAGQPVAATGGIMATIGSLLSGVIHAIQGLFAKLFGGSAGPASTGPATPALPAVPGAAPAAQDPHAIAQQYGLLDTPQNVAFFQQVVQAESSEPNVVGPGATNADAVNELQGLLAGWGYAVPTTGTFDQATAKAVVQWKTAQGLTESFQLANGQPGVTPFVDARTRAKMLQIVKRDPAATSPATPAPAVQSAPTAPPPSAPATAPAIPGAVTPASAALSGADLAAAQAAGILASADNFAAFQAVMKGIQADANAMGPGLNEAPDAVNELQGLLAGWGYTVPTTGKFDDATVAAVMKFKQDNNLTYAYKMADGSVGNNPYIDAPTKAAMLKKIGVNG